MADVVHLAATTPGMKKIAVSSNTSAFASAIVWETFRRIRSCFSELKNDSTTGLSQPLPQRPQKDDSAYPICYSQPEEAAAGTTPPV